MIATSLASGAALFTGGAVFVLLGLAWLRGLLERAENAGILAPVLVGLGLRLVLMLVIHGVSLIRDEGGIMFVDDRTYLHAGMRIADGWRAGAVSDPSNYANAGTLVFGYQVLVAGAFLLIHDIIAGKLVNVLASATTVLLAARVAERVWGPATRRRAAWIAALAPGVVWWAVPLMKESVSTFLFTAGLLAMLSLNRRWAPTALMAILAALVVVRPAAALALVIGGVATGAVVALRNRETFAFRRLALRAGAVGVLGLIVLAAYGGVYHHAIDTMVHNFRKSGVDSVPGSVLKSLASPYPWTFDADTHNWDMGLYPGMWCWYALYPLAALGVIRHRRRPEVLLLFVVALAYLTANSFTSGYVFRQRSSVEPLIIVLAIGGLSSWRALGRAAAGAWAVVVVFAGLQSHGDPVVMVSIAAAAAAAYGVSTRLLEAPMAVGGGDHVLDAVRALSAPVTWWRVPWRRLREVGSRRLATRPARRRWPVVAVAAVAAVGLTVPAVSGLGVDASAGLASDVSLGLGQSSAARAIHGDVSRYPDGYAINGRGVGRLDVVVGLGSAKDGHPRLRLYAFGGPLHPTTMQVLSAGRPVLTADVGQWDGHVLDLSGVVADDATKVRLRFVALNPTTVPRLFVGRVQAERVPDDARPRTGTWLLILWLAAVCTLLLALRGTASWQLGLPVGVAVLTATSWPMARAAAYDPLPPDLDNLWAQVRGGGWLGGGHGPLWGAFDGHSALAGQALALVRPLVGTGDAGARTATVLLAVAGLATIWWAAGRIAGFAGAAAATTLILLTDGFRTAAVTQPDVWAILLAAAIFAVALDLMLETPSGRALLALTGATALVVLAAPLLGIGAIVVLVVAGALRLPPRDRGRWLAYALVLLAILLAPSRLTLAADHGGAFADLRAQLDGAADAHRGGFVAGTVRGVQDSIRAVEARSISGVFGLVALLLLALGAAFAMLVGRLRLPAVASVLAALPVAYLVHTQVAPPLAAAAFALPALLVATGALLRTLNVLRRGGYE